MRRGYVFAGVVISGALVTVFVALTIRRDRARRAASLPQLHSVQVNRAQTPPQPRQVHVDISELPAKTLASIQQRVHTWDPAAHVIFAGPVTPRQVMEAGMGNARDDPLYAVVVRGHFNASGLIPMMRPAGTAAPAQYITYVWNLKTRGATHVGISPDGAGLSGILHDPSLPNLPGR